jgi:hypothetical protein
MATFPPMIQPKENDERLLNLAHAVARAYKYICHTAIQNLATTWLEDWEEFQGKEYLDSADVEWFEKRIQLLLQMLTTSYNPERKALLRALAHNIDAYAHVVAHCPSGMFSDDIDERVIDVLAKVD